jgi:hypothetical protein
VSLYDGVTCTGGRKNKDEDDQHELVAARIALIGRCSWDSAQSSTHRKQRDDPHCVRFIHSVPQIPWRLLVNLLGIVFMEAVSLLTMTMGPIVVQQGFLVSLY